ncbi:hypothetical protein C8P63_11760 [Melghirimyces profundicolus]|uniref:Uncharacterized protein n=1 Tax=Melghirimyces profundicolus TaxID=1242148 RepID=A0A2T6BQJ7_9BACL|nr:hypothetical protein [Melghirimyces profundicolus]PTX58312.1 hypothetical protein C8P63_11760 [Melghirimyces profundicolus]
MREEGEYERFSEQVKRLILLEVLLLVLRRDRARLEELPLKTRRALIRWLSRTTEQVRRELVETRMELFRLGGRIVEVRQCRDCREVRARFKGYVYTMRYLNGWLRSECEDFLLRSWAGKNTSGKNPPGEHIMKGREG